MHKRDVKMVSHILRQVVTIYLIYWSFVVHNHKAVLMEFVLVALQQSMAWLPCKMMVRSRSSQLVTAPQRSARQSPS